MIFTLFVIFAFFVICVFLGVFLMHAFFSTARIMNAIKARDLRNGYEQNIRSQP